MRLIFIAPPGAGKGTQSSLIEQEFGIHQISTGDILREHKNKRTKLGKIARSYMDAGELVPDNIMIEMLKEEISKDKYSNGFMLDGFPRTQTQAEELDNILTEMNQKLNAILVLNVPKSELISRLSARRSCKTCSKSYHLIFNPPQSEKKCDEPCGGPLFQRADDTRETIINRLKIYESKTQSLIDYYAGNGLTFPIDGLGEVDEVFDRIKLILNNLKK
jgi:adenylate kinase